MKRGLYIFTIVFLLSALFGCGTNENKKKENDSHSSLASVQQESTTKEESENENQEEFQTFELEKDGKKSIVELTIEGNVLIKEKVRIEGPFSSIQATNRVEAEEAVVKMNEKIEEVEGIFSEYTIQGDNVMYTIETDYPKANLEALGISEDMMDSKQNLPLAKVRIEDYEAMGYKKLK